LPRGNRLRNAWLSSGGAPAAEVRGRSSNCWRKHAPSGCGH